MTQATARLVSWSAVALLAACGGSGGGGGGAAVASGALVAGFGDGGVVALDIGPGYEIAAGLATDGTFLYVAGSDPGVLATDRQWRIEKRRVSDGSLVTAFGSQGVVVSNPSLDADGPAGIVIDDSAMYVVGSDRSAGPSNPGWRIEKRDLVTGAFVRDFGVDGVVFFDPGPGDDSPTAVAKDATALYIVGTDSALGGIDLRWRIEKRFLDDGAPDPTFGNAGPGFSVSNPGPSSDFPFAVALDTEGIYIGGLVDVGGDARARVTKFNISSGGIAAFPFGSPYGTLGFVDIPGTVNVEYVLALALDSTGLYVGSVDYGVPDGQWRIDKRDPIDGSLIGSFGIGGVAVSDPSPGDDAPQWIVPDGQGSIYVAGLSKPVPPTDRAWHLEKRDATTGDLVASFGSGGQITFDPGPFTDDSEQLVTDGEFLYWCGTEALSPTDSVWRIEKRTR